MLIMHEPLLNAQREIVIQALLDSWHADIEETLLAVMAAGVPAHQIRVDGPRLEVEGSSAVIVGEVRFVG